MESGADSFVQDDQTRVFIILFYSSSDYYLRRFTSITQRCVKPREGRKVGARSFSNEANRINWWNDQSEFIQVHKLNYVKFFFLFLYSPAL